MVGASDDVIGSPRTARLNVRRRSLIERRERENAAVPTTWRSARALLAVLAIVGLGSEGAIVSASPGDDTRTTTPSGSTSNSGAWQVTIIDLGLLPGGIYASA